jgi:hypothetical protein
MRVFFLLFIIVTFLLGLPTTPSERHLLEFNALSGVLLATLPRYGKEKSDMNM